MAMAVSDASSWIRFANSVDEAVLLSTFQYLSPSQVLIFAQTAASELVRLDEQPKREGGSIAHNLAIVHAGDAVARAVAEAMQQVQTSSVGTYLNVLRLLACEQPVTVPARQAMEIAASSKTAEEIDRFLSAVFEAEVWTHCRKGDSKLRGCATAKLAADTAVSALLNRGDAQSRQLIESVTSSVRRADRELELLYDSFDVRLYGDVARRRSAIAFLRQLLPEVTPCAADLDVATEMLDETIKGLVDEGFELSCRFPRHGMPFRHWWLFLGGAGGAGKYGMCG